VDLPTACSLKLAELRPWVIVAAAWKPPVCLSKCHARRRRKDLNTNPAGLDISFQKRGSKYSVDVSLSFV
jgi:hypothetical protein